MVYLGFLGVPGAVGLLLFAAGVVEWGVFFHLIIAPITFLGVILTLPAAMRPRPVCYGVYAAVNLTLLTFGLAIMAILSFKTTLDKTWPATVYIVGDVNMVTESWVYYISVLCYGMSGLLAAREAWHTRWRARVQRGDDHG